MAKRPGGAMIQSEIPTQSQLFPIFTKWGELGSKSQLLPMFVTIVAVSFMFMYSQSSAPMIYETGHPQRWIYTSPFILIVATYLTLLSLYFIYRLVGKRKSWVAMLGCMAFTAGYLWLMMTQGAFGFVYDFFHGFLAGGEPNYEEPFFTLFYRHFVGTGFFEEFVKALPLFAILLFGNRLSKEMQKKFKIEEPLDGILFGAAAGGGFALMETIGQYVPRNLVQTWMKLALDIQGVKHGYNIPLLEPNQAWSLIKQGIALMGTSPGVQLLIPRSLDQAFGHMAYSGIFGYFIGLSVMKPERKWLILFIGLCTASLPHALWDSVGIFDSDMIQMGVALLSYAVLAAAVLKAREISPNRQFLQPSVVFGDMGYAAQSAAAASGVPPSMVPDPPVYTMHPQVVQAAVEVPALPPGTPSLRIGTRFLVIMPGLRILEHQAPGLKPTAAGGPVAEVTRNPQDPAVLGLTNLSLSTWVIVTSSGSQRQILNGQTVKLAQGTKINFGEIDGEVR
ncbi:MAG: PrsW family glutamic-type intramembrane protease [Acidobacteriota bacterium]